MLQDETLSDTPQGLGSGASDYANLAHPEQESAPLPKIIHNPQTDLILNHHSQFTAWPELIAAFYDGKPSDWSPYNNAEHLFTGEVADQKLLVKERLFRAGPDGLARLREAAQESENEQAHKTKFYGYESLAREIELAPLVHAVTNSEAAQEMAKTHGFSGISYVEPLMGVITKYPEHPEYNTKSTVYEYIPGTKQLDDLGEEPEWTPEDVAELTQALGALLEQGGIAPLDLGPGQILVDNNRQLYLIDTEGYAKTPANK